MHDTPSNLHLIRQMTKQGHPPAIVMQRCCEHLGWQGPHPTIREIVARMEYFQGSRAVSSQPVAVPASAIEPLGAGTASTKKGRST
jgi:hypothetical protein